jgi:hypothetical protein
MTDPHGLGYILINLGLLFGLIGVAVVAATSLPYRRVWWRDPPDDVEAEIGMDLPPLEEHLRDAVPSELPSRW